MDFNICRLCLVSKRTDHTKFKNIFSSTESFSNKELKLIDAIVECAPIEINENDNLPKNICLKCLEKLQTSYEFRQVCVQSDIKLKLSLEKQEPNLNKIFVKEFTDDDDVSIKEEPENIDDAHLVDDSVKNELDSDEEKISCEECGKKYTSAKSFQRHLKQVHSVKCVHCSKKFPNENDLYLHNEKLHTFRCEICAETFIWEVEIEKHYSEVHLSRYIKSEDNDSTEVTSEKTEYLSDDVCDNKTKKSSDLVKLRKSFKCSQCDKNFKTKDSLNIHLRIHTGERPFACDVCGKSFKQKVHLSIHKRIHTGEKNYICELCPKSFSTNSDLTKHKRVHLKSENSEPSFQCDMCDKAFIRNSNLKRHIEKMHKKFKYQTDDMRSDNTKCPICDQSFGTNLDLKQHIKITHNKKIPGENRDPFTCNNCGKGFISKHELSEHLLLHAGEYSYMCDICGYVFEQSISLKSHMLIHTGVKAFSCKICSKEFTNKSFLRLHAAVHNDDLPHKCKLCPKRFKWRVGLWRHEKEHSGERPYKCNFCSRGFIEAEGLRRHVRVHTGERPYKCEICFKTFKQGLKHHMKMCHSKN